MTQLDPQTTESDGLSLHIRVRFFADLQALLRQCLRVGILRCVSPERAALCAEPATDIHWQDQAEYYPCCGAHGPGPPQWTGSTSFRPHDVELIVIPDKARAWLATLPPEQRARFTEEPYDRIAESVE